MPMDIPRFADASFNRLGEGFWALENLAHFLLDDTQLTREPQEMVNEERSGFA